MVCHWTNWKLIEQDLNVNEERWNFGILSFGKEDRGWKEKFLEKGHTALNSSIIEYQHAAIQVSQFFCQISSIFKYIFKYQKFSKYIWVFQVFQVYCGHPANAARNGQT